MMKLIKLELVKNKLSTYLWAALFIFIFGLAMCFLMGAIPYVEQMEGIPLNAIPGIEILSDWKNLSMLISLLFAMAFSVLSAVMHTRFTVDEYMGKRAVLLFSYPQSRSKILFAKCSLVFVFTALGMVFSNILALGIFAFISNIFHIIPVTFQLSMLPGILITAGVCGLLAASVGLVAMRVGFWKKSLAATIVTAVILIAPFGNIASFLPTYSSGIQMIGMVILLFVGLLVFGGLMRKVSRMEAL